MKYILSFFLLCGIAFGQGLKFGDGQPIQTAQKVGGINNVLVAYPNATINFCNSPANAVPCTNKATTYTDSTLTTPCATSTQVVLAGTTNCVATTDSLGNWGVWVAGGQYVYTVTTSAGVSSGPYPASLVQGTGGGSGCQVNPNDAGWALAGTPSIDQFIGAIGPG